MNDNQQVRLLSEKLQSLIKKQEDLANEMTLLKHELSEILNQDIDNSHILQAENQESILQSVDSENSNTLEDDNLNQIENPILESVYNSKIELDQVFNEVHSEEEKQTIEQDNTVIPPISNQNPFKYQSYDDWAKTKYKYRNQEYSNKKSSSLISEESKANLEKFIGENLINKIGIIILIIGVSIGAKYSIDHNLISPLTRIILAYLSGLGLLAFAIKLKEKYENFSAVLLSGAMSIMYFVSFAAYTYYQLIPQVFTFVLMVIFTIFTVLAAINYKKQVIAHIGLVGAYCIPFLLSDGSGKVHILYSYMSIINIGILVVAIKYYWKPLYYLSFASTWIIYATWFLEKYQTHTHFHLAFVFLTIFFVIFYIMNIAYKVANKVEFKTSDLSLILINAFLYYSIGYSLLSNHNYWMHFLGLFTLLNALIHFAISVYIKKQKNEDQKAFYLAMSMVLLCITIAIPVQFDGNYVTIAWSIQAAILFYFGRSKNIPIFETFAYPILFISLISLISDLSNVQSYSNSLVNTKVQLVKTIPFLNTNFISAIICILSFFAINYVNDKFKSQLKQLKEDKNETVMSFLFKSIWIIFLYSLLYLEIKANWHKLSLDVYTAIFVAGLFYFSRKRKVWVYEVYVYPLIAFLTLSLFSDWNNVFYIYHVNLPSTKVMPIVNTTFLTSVLAILAMYFITYWHKNKSDEYYKSKSIFVDLSIAIKILSVLLLYAVFCVEISLYFNQLYLESFHKNLNANGLERWFSNIDINNFKSVWLYNYTIVFSIILTFFNIYRTKNKNLAYANSMIQVLLILYFLMNLLPVLGELRDHLLDIKAQQLYSSTHWNLTIRYISILFLAFNFFAFYKNLKNEIFSEYENIAKYLFKVISYFTILCLLSNELLNIMQILKITNAEKLGLSILWGVYSLVLIVVGIWKNDKYLRLGAMALFALTLIKLFFYDLISMDTISKTIIFVSLGLLLLLISFLYNKYTARINNSDEV